MPDSFYTAPVYLRGDMVAALTGAPTGTGNPTDPEQTITMPGAVALGGGSDLYRFVWHKNLDGTDTEFLNGQIWRLEVYNPAADLDGDMTTGTEGWTTVPGYEELSPKQDIVSTGAGPNEALGAGDEYIVFEELNGSGTFLLYDLNGGLPTSPTDLDYLR